MEAIRQLLARQGLPWCSAAVVGLAMCLMVNGVFDGTLMSQVEAVSFPLRISESPLSGGVGVIAACAVLAVVAARRGAIRRKGNALRATASGAASASFPSMRAAVVLALSLVVPLALLYLSTAGLVPAALGEVGGLAISAASAALLALWACALSPLGWKHSLLVFLAALLLDTLVDVVASVALVDAAVAVVAFAAAAASPLLLSFVQGRLRDKTGGGIGGADRAEGGAARGGDGAVGLPLWLSIACVALYGFLMGRVQSLGSMGYSAAAGGFLSDHAISVGAIAACLFMYLLVHLRRPHAVTRVAVLVTLMAALYLSGVFGSAMEPGGTIAMTVARFICFAYIWLLTCDGARDREAEDGEANAGDWAGAGSRRPLLPVLAFSAGWGAFTLVNTLSTKIGLAIGAGPGIGFVLYNVAIVACFAALILVELLPHRLAAASQPESETSGTSSEDALVARCQKLAQEHGLTARELDVLVPLVRGRSAASIASTLGMSTETARTHIRHIYQKTDIHSREELMDAIEQ